MYVSNKVAIIIVLEVVPFARIQHYCSLFGGYTHFRLVCFRLDDNKMCHKYYPKGVKLGKFL